MKKCMLVAVLLASVVTLQAFAANTCCEQSNKLNDDRCLDNNIIKEHGTFFSTRPLWDPTSPELLTQARQLWHKEEGLNCYPGGVQVSVFGSKSTDPDKIAAYFMPRATSTILISNDSENDNPDVVGEQLGIFTQTGNFKSTVHWAPIQSVIGVGFDWQQIFWERDNGTNCWVEIATSVQRVKNNMNMQETILDDGGGVIQATSNSGPFPIPNANPPNGGAANTGIPPIFVPNATAAFQQASWCFGRVECGPHETTQLADIQVYLGREWVKNEHCHMDTFLGVIIPTANTPKGRLVFEPIVGHNHHFAFMMGSSMGFKVWEDCDKDRSVCFEFDTHWHYLFKRHEVRSFDLKNKPWSRYMQVYASQEDAERAYTLGDVYSYTPGINVFTRELEITPRYTRVFNSAFVYNSPCFQAEAGYNFYCREAEDVELSCKCEFPTTVALKQTAPRLSAAATGGAGETNPVQQIGNDYTLTNGLTPTAFSDYLESVITLGDLDLASAAHPGTLSHTLYGSVGTSWECECYPRFVNVGASYEFDRDNLAVNRWVFWLKGGVSY